MLWKSTLGLLALAELSAAVPSPYWAKQHILEQAPLKPNGPYHPGHRDQYDHKIDAGEFHDETSGSWQSQHQPSGEHKAMIPVLTFVRLE